MRITMRTGIIGEYRAKKNETIDVDDATAQRLIENRLADLADARVDLDDDFEVRDATATATHQDTEAPRKRVRRKKAK